MEQTDLNVNFKNVYPCRQAVFGRRYEKGLALLDSTESDLKVDLK